MNLAEILPVGSDPIGLDLSADLLIIIPTVATPSVVVPTLDRLIATSPPRTRILLSINPAIPADAREVVDECARRQPDAAARGIDLVWHEEDGLRGFGGSINIGTRWAIRNHGGLPPVIAIWNDDLIATPGAVERTVAAFATTEIEFFGDLPDEEGRRPRKPVEQYGRIGMVGPVTDVVGGNQRVNARKEIERLGLDGFAAEWAARHDGEVVAAEFLSGFCMFWSRDCFLDLSIYDGESYRGVFDADRYPVAGYEDNDLCARVERSGWRSAVARSAFLLHRGHQTFDALFPDWNRGMRNRLAYLERWRSETGRDQRVVGVQRVRLSSVQDLHLWRHSVLRSATLLDGLAVLLTGSPAALASDAAGWSALAPSLPPLDRGLVERCAEATSTEEVVALVAEWLSVTTTRVRPDFAVSVDYWTGDWNERDERNAAIALGEALPTGADGAPPDWLLSIDHDEVIEDRISRAMLDRLMAHPDPLVASYETGWLNHWEGSRMVRIDRPWGDGGSMRGGMTGPRFWRVNRAAPRRILHGNEKGLHCGNAPLFAFPAVRVSGLRFRHFGYTDAHQRRRKRAFYDQVDPNPDPASIGGADYGHITDDEGMTLRPYVAANGVGLFMLVHSGESVGDVARLVDSLYSLVDRIVLVWTEDWWEEHRAWDRGEVALDRVDWSSPRTGPSEDLARLARLYGCEWTHQPLNDDLSGARNAGIDALRGYMGEGLGWALFLDPDEHLSDDYRPLRSIRSMAEVSRGWGWMIRFSNLLRGGGSSYSESVRLFRLDPAGVMRMSGRVHEGFDKAFADLRAAGEHPGVRYAPFEVVHLGLAKDDAAIAEKLSKYRRMLRAEIAENPYSPGAWTSLGMQYLNDGEEDLALACYERGILCAGTSYLPFKEAAYWHLRRARAYLAESIRLTVKGHPVRRAMEPLAEALADMVPMLPKVGSVTLDPLPLPAFPIPEEAANALDYEEAIGVDPTEIDPGGGSA